MRFDSTSGGLFSALAELIYKEGGYVGGAIFNDDYSVSHFISNDKKFAYHEFAEKQSRVTMIFSSLEDTMVSLIIHIDLNSKKVIRIQSTDINYCVNKLNEYGINMDALLQINTLPTLTKLKFKLSDKLTSELLSRMSSDLESFRKMMSE